jgi:trk system potassium uptake protein TrkH
LPTQNMPLPFASTFPSGPSKQNTLAQINIFWLVPLTYLTLIIIGSILLTLPISHQDNIRIHYIDALFMATSASCVTGLTTLNVPETFNFFGQMILLILIQTGGLGIMSASALFLVIAGQRLSINQQRIITGSWGKTGKLRVKNILIYIITFVFGIEFMSTLTLYIQFQAAYSEHSTPWILWQSLFHAISAFCNAGISIFPTQSSPSPWIKHETISLSISTMAILGSIGLLTLINITQLRPWKKNILDRGILSLQSKIALVMAGILLLTGTLFYSIFESSNIFAHAHSWHEKITWSFFQSAMSRTAGFSVVDVNQMLPVSLLLTILLMFIGGSPGSMAGGIKTITFAILIASAWAALRRQQNTQIFHRRISRDLTNTALMLTLFAASFIILITMILMITELHHPSSQSHHQWLAIIFETVSAFATVGLSTGITPDLTPLGKIIITFTMFVGRLGPLMLAIYLTKPILPWHIRYPKENISIG